MIYIPVFIGLALLVLLLVWQVPARNRVFVIRVCHGVPAATRGNVGQGFLAEVVDIVNRHGIQGGSIFGLSCGGRVVLGFSRTIPANSRQAFRNVWTMHAR